MLNNKNFRVDEDLLHITKNSASLPVVRSTSITSVDDDLSILLKDPKALLQRASDVLKRINGKRSFFLANTKISYFRIGIGKLNSI